VGGEKLKGEDEYDLYEFVLYILYENRTMKPIKIVFRSVREKDG
jgi:hypothetical protein